jgi:AcrR family transcriptional regulator
MAVRKGGAERRREIAEAALKVIAEQGLARFTAVTVAREVGVSDAALFRHFPTKEAIVLAAIDRVEEVLFERFPPADPDPIGRLARFFADRVAALRTNPGAVRLLGSEQLAQAAPPEGVEKVAALRNRSRAFVRGCLAEASRAGLLADGLGPAEGTVLVVGALLALAHGGAGERPTPALAARVWDALERTLRRGPDPQRRSPPATP